MSQEKLETYYPGQAAEVLDILKLANSYQSAALAILNDVSKKNSISYAPARLCSIHAIELYLNAFLRYEGFEYEKIRGLMHGLDNYDFATKLKLKKKTALHLEAMTNKREYLIARYAPELFSQQTELNRLTATLNEIMSKTTKYVEV